MRPSVRLLQAYLNKKQWAVNLRKRGYSYLEIAQTLKVSKSTAYYWARQVKLSKSAQARIEKKLKESFGRGLAAYNKIYSKVRSREAAEIRERYKKKAFQEISQKIKKVSMKNLLLIGLSLYWAEGYKKGRNATVMSNSDPAIIQVTMRFFREVCRIPDAKIKARIHLYPQINPKTATRYWSKITGLSFVQFTKPQVQVSRASKGKRHPNTLPYGTLHLTISNTELTWRIKGWIEGIVSLMRG